MFRRRSSRARRAHSTPRRRPRIRQRRLSLEPLEERPLLAVMTVTALTDDTLANLAGDSQLSLREAIQAINTGMNVDGIGPTSGIFGVNDEVQFAPGLFGGGPQTITLADAAGELDLLESMTITGPGALLLTIDAGDGTDNMPNTGDGFRIFNIDDGVIGTDSPATLTGLTLTGGDASSSGGAIRTFEGLAVRDSVISGNAAFGGSSGGGIYANTVSNRNLEVTRTIIARNTSGSDGGGVFATGSMGTISFQNSVIQRNTTTGFGGGLELITQSNGTINIIDTTVSGNSATSSGGGAALSLSLGGTANVAGSTIANNDATARGGGIYLFSNVGTATITQSTISGNRADDDGGGIFANTAAGASTLITHSTITQNVSDDDSSGSGSGGGLYATGGGTLSVRNTIIAQNFDNSATNADDLDLTTSAPGTLFFNFNLVRNNTGSGLAAGNPDANGNIIGTMAVPIDPVLGTLQASGGPTLTHALLAGSPAIDAGDPAFAPPPANDQRGAPFVRVFDGAAPAGAVIDIGAYERQDFGAPQALVVDILDDEVDGNFAPGDLSLREAIGLANGNVGIAETITFAAGLNGGTILLTLGRLTINDPLTINASALAAGITIDASGNDPTPAVDDAMGTQVFEISDSVASAIAVTLNNLTLTGADSFSSGGAIRSFENLTIIDSTITGNHTGSTGGGIASFSGNLTILGTTISQNAAYAGGAIYFDTLNDDLTITNSFISANAADNRGGGVDVENGDQLTVNSSTISGNFAGTRGGGIYLIEAAASAIINSTLSGNDANSEGGGIFVITRMGDATTIAHSTITGNTADDNDDDPMGFGGGGVYALIQGALNLNHTIIAENFDNSGTAPDFDPSTEAGSTFTLNFNLIGNNLGSGLASANPDLSGNRIGTNAAPLDPGLAGLTDNGGPTPTHALEPGSLAIDNGDPLAVAGAGGIPSFDQRGNPFTRVFNGDGAGGARIDIGAFEVNAVQDVDPDDFEENDTLATATVLGSPPFETIRDLSITAGNGDNIPNDIDYFKYTAHHTGKLAVRIHFQDDFGDLDLEIRDMFDNIIASSTGTADIEEIIIPVVFQEMYFIRVFGFLPMGEDIADANNYTLEVENFPAPVPTGVVLDPASDTGMMDNDNITSDDTPTILIQTDVLNFVDTNNNDLFQDPDTAPAGTEDELDALSPDEANRIRNNTPMPADEDGGIAVEVTFVNTTDGTFVTGFAEAVIGTLPDVYRFTPSAPLTPGVYLVTARTRVFDGQADAANMPDQETNRTNASPPLRLVIDTVGAGAGSISADMLDASDTGMLDDDNVTNKMQPAFQGIAPANSKVRIFANGELVGQTVAGSDSSDVGHAVGGIGGLATDGLGLWEITVEPLADNGYDITIEVEDAAGNVTIFNPQFNGPDQPIDIVIDTLDPNTPYLDLLDDTGRHDNDNITKVNTPLVTMTSTDPNIALAQILFTDNLKFRIFDRFENTTEFLLYDSALDAAVDAMNTAGDMFTALTFIEERLPEQFFALFGGAATPAVIQSGLIGVLADGVHNLKLEVEDRAGNISHDFLFEITIDTLTPPVSFGLDDLVNDEDGLTASSDSGVTFLPDTFADRVTSDTTPTLWGRAEADTVVRLYLDRDADGIIDLTTDTFLGQTTAIPLDGNDAFPDGYWEITSALDLNQLLGIPKDGLRRLLVTAEDVAGNPMPMSVDNLPVVEDGVASLHIFIDTQGPQITDVTINDLTSDIFDLFDPKPTQNGPTPPVDSLTIHFRDLPSRVDQPGVLNDFLYAALAFDNANQFGAAAPGNYLLVGDAVGVVPIESVVVNDLGAAQIAGTLTSVTGLTVVSDANLVGDALQPEIGDYIRFDAGPAAGQVRRIVNYNAALGQMTLDIPLANLPNAGDAYTVTKIALATVTLNFFEPLADDRYTLTISDNITDPANNALDGETNPPEPQEDPFFPSGDGVPGGDFVGRFTVDTRPEIGVWAAGIVHIDTNGNFYFDPENVDFTNRDLVYTLGFSSDYIFAGNFVLGAGGVADGFDKLAVYGRVGDQWRFLIDFDNDGVPDEEFLAPTINGIPVAGNFDGNAANGDEVGIFTGSAWFFDTNHDFIVDDGFATDYAGFPVAGDFDADGDDDVGTYIASPSGGNLFHIDINTAGLGSDININGSADHTFRVGVPGLGTFGFPGVRERPVAADMNADGADDLGLWVPDGTAILPGDQGEWFFLLSDIERNGDGKEEFGGNGIVGETVIDRIISGGIVDFVPFTTTPFGNDLYARFGNSFALPIVGNFDPPVTSGATTTQQTAQSAPTASTTTSTTSTQVSTPPRAGSYSTPISSAPTAPTTAPTPAPPPATAATATTSKTSTAAATTAAAATTKVAVPTITPSSYSNKNVAKPAKTTTSTTAAKKIAVPTIQPKTTKVATTVAAPKTTATKTTKITAKVATPVAPPPAKTTKAAKATATTNKKSSIAAPISAVAAKTASPPKNTAPKSVAAPIVKKSVAAVNLQPVTTIDAYTSLAPTNVVPPQPMPPTTAVVHAVKASARPAPPSPSITRVAPAFTLPKITASIATRTDAPSVQVSTLSGALELVATSPAEPIRTTSHGLFESAVADAAVTDLRLTLADVTTDADAIAADRQSDPAGKDADDELDDDSDDELALALARDSVSLRVK